MNSTDLALDPVQPRSDVVLVVAVTWHDQQYTPRGYVAERPTQGAFQSVLGSAFMSTTHSRSRIHEATTIGDRVADTVVGALGSWRFIIIQTVIVAIWVMVNLVEVIFKPFDPYPFILLNLAFSTQAAYAAPLILMSSNRQSAKDEVRDDLESREVEELHAMTTQIREITLTQKDLMSDIHAIATHLGMELSTPPPTP
jgi:uncharacterized membrane protein